MHLNDFRIFRKKGVKVDVINGKRSVIYSTLYLAIHKDLTLPVAIENILGEDNSKALLSEIGAKITEWNRYDTYIPVFDITDIPSEVKSVLSSSLRKELGEQGVIPIVIIDRIEQIEEPISLTLPS